MRITGGEKLRAYIAKHPESSASMLRWESVVADVEWRTPADIKATFRSADFVGGKVVFNVGGNNHRIIATILFPLRAVLVLHALTHEEYDKDKWK